MEEMNLFALVSLSGVVLDSDGFVVFGDIDNKLNEGSCFLGFFWLLSFNNSNELSWFTYHFHRVVFVKILPIYSNIMI